MQRYAPLAALALCSCASGFAALFEPACPPVPEPPPHPVHSAEGLQLIMDEAYGLMEPIHLIADTKVTVIGGTWMELEIYLPDGSKRVHSFTHRNAVRVMPNCDPVVGGRGTGCEGLRAQVMGTGGTRIELPREYIQGLGWYTAVLHRPDTGERTSRRFQVVISADREILALDGWEPRCADLPEVVDGYQRVACDIARMPVAAVQGAWGDRALYRGEGSCLASAYSVSLDHGMRFGFQTNGLGVPEVRRYPEGEVRVQRRKDGQVAFWLGDNLFLAVEPPGGEGRAERFVRAMLRARPPLPPRPREFPKCAAVPSLGKQALEFQPIAEIAKKNRVYRYYEGNTLAGVDLSTIISTYFFDMAGFRPKDVIQSIDDEPLNTPERFLGVIERLGRPGRKRVLVWRRPYGGTPGYGCLELEIRPPPR